MAMIVIWYQKYFMISKELIFCVKFKLCLFLLSTCFDMSFNLSDFYISELINVT